MWPLSTRGSFSASASASEPAPLPPPESPSDPHCRFRFPVASGAEMRLLFGFGCCLLLIRTCIYAYTLSITSDLIGLDRIDALQQHMSPAVLSVLCALFAYSLRLCANATLVRNRELQRRVVHFGGHSPLLSSFSLLFLLLYVWPLGDHLVHLCVSSTRTLYE